MTPPFLSAHARQPTTSYGSDPAQSLDLPMRRYDVSYFSANGQIKEISRQAPATSPFESAFAALCHGALVQTDNGLTPVEDLWPGDIVHTADGTTEILRWRGSIEIQPTADTNGMELVRFTTDALGLNRPSPDLVLGPAARILHRAKAVRMLTSRPAAFIPAHDFVDGVQMIALRPFAPVRAYQLGFDRHQILNINGIEVESLYTGNPHSLGIRGEMLGLYLSLMPHKMGFDDPDDMRYPRLRMRDLDLS